MHSPKCIHVQKWPLAILQACRMIQSPGQLIEKPKFSLNKNEAVHASEVLSEMRSPCCFLLLPILLYLSKAQNNLFHPIISPTGHSQAIWLSQDSDSLSQMI